MGTECWKWEESAWQSDKIDWKNCKRIVAGIDIGVNSTQAVILCDNELFAYANIYTGPDFINICKIALEKAIGNTKMSIEDIESISATGFGKKNAEIAQNKFDEITCHARGARYMFGPEVKTVVDLGAQSTKAITLYEWDRVRDFKISDKCANGFGRKIEMMSQLLQVPLCEMGSKSLEVEKDPEPVSTTCYNFAYPEIMGQFRPAFREKDFDENEVLASFLFTVAWRALSTIGKIAPLDIGKIKLDEKVAFTGGLAKNIGITKRIERELNIKAAESSIDAQLAGAIGAALLS